MVAKRGGLLNVSKRLWDVVIEQINVSFLAFCVSVLIKKVRSQRRRFNDRKEAVVKEGVTALESTSGAANHTEPCTVCGMNTQCMLQAGFSFLHSSLRHGKARYGVDHGAISAIS